MTAPTPTGAEVWVTLPDRSRLLHRAEDAAFEAGPLEADCVIAIDDATRYQALEGIGAALTESSAWLLMAALSDAQRADVLRRLFNREDGIGLSYLRLPMGASDFALGDYTYLDLPAGEADPDLTGFSIARDEAYVMPVLRQALALNPELRLMGSPWSAPAWMKSSGHLHGGTLRPEFYAAFAQYHVKFAQAYAAAGLPIDTLTPQNEPLLSLDGYPTMLLSAEAQRILVRDHLGPALRHAALGTRLLILDHNWDLVDTALEILGDPAAAAFVDGVAFHCYAGSVEAQARVQAAFPDKGIWFTECSGGQWATDFGANLAWTMRHLVAGNFRNWGQSLLLWNLALDEAAGPQNGGCTNCRGVVTVDRMTGAVTYNEEYYALGHVSRFVRPGAVRVASVSPAEGGPDQVAFLNPDGRLALVILSAEAATVAIAWRGRHCRLRLPAGALVTLRWPAQAAA